MIPDFPKFKKISRHDRESILSYTESYLPYSDYNFNSLWAWDTTSKMKLSVLNKNLVVLMPDYLTSEPIISFIGTRKLSSTISQLREYCEKKKIDTTFQLIPEVTSSRLKDASLKIKEERDHFDYIFSTKKLAKLNGKAFKVKRHLVNRFIKDYPEAEFRTSSLSEKNSVIQINEVLENWTKKHSNQSDIQLEHKAIKRLLKLGKIDGNELILSGVYFKDELMAFSIDEILNKGYAISHFYKVKKKYIGISEFLNQCTASFLHESGVELWNWEQDLGIEGLRKSKTSYRPVNFLKKYNLDCS